MGIIECLSNYFAREGEEAGVRRRQSVLDGLVGVYGSVGLVPLKVFEREARIYGTRDDLVSFK